MTNAPPDASPDTSSVAHLDPCLAGLSRPVTETGLGRALETLGIQTKTLEHAPTFTVNEGADVKATLPGGHTKNLFMTDGRGGFVLVSAWAESRLRLNRLHKVIGGRRLSFGAAEDMQRLLGVTPGSVTGFAVLNDTDGAVRFVLDAALKPFDVWNFHPLRNDRTTAISAADFVAFATACGHPPTFVDFAAAPFIE